VKLKLVKKIDEARGTKSFFWEPEAKVDFLPGQYFYFTLPNLNYPDPRGATRHFTISSSPTEGNLLQLTTRIRQESGYKKTLDELPIGVIVEGEGPNGTLYLDKNVSGTQIFVVGGIGITPFRSIIKYNIDNNLKIPMYLIYSNSDSDFVFKKELDQWQKENDYIKVSYFDSSIFGHLDKLAIEKLIENWFTPTGAKLVIGNSVLWTVGPPPFTDALENVFEKMKIPSDNIRSEKFTGY